MSGSEFLKQLSAPARRALENAGISSIEELASFSEKELLKLHGIGPASIPALKKAMATKGLKFTV